MTASGDGSARLWDPATGEQLAALGGFTGTVFAASFSANGTRVMAVSGDGSTRVFACDVCGTVARVTGAARRLVPWSLTATERQKYLSGT